MLYLCSTTSSEVVATVRNGFLLCHAENRPAMGCEGLRLYLLYCMDNRLDTRPGSATVPLYGLDRPVVAMYCVSVN